MRIASFNTQHCLDYLNQVIDFQLFADTIVSLKADVVGLNEMRGAGIHPEYTDQTKALSDRSGMQHYFFAKAIDVDGPNPYGNAMLSKYPIAHAEAILIPDPSPKRYDPGRYETRCLLKAVLENGLTILVCHFGLNPDEQENAVQTILAHIKDEKCVLMGDFNVTPDSKILEPLYQRMNDTAVYFTEPKLSFPSDKPAKKIDYIFTSPDLEVTAANIPDLVVSDHRPYFIDINL